MVKQGKINWLVRYTYWGEPTNDQGFTLDSMRSCLEKNPCITKYWERDKWTEYDNKQLMTSLLHPG